LFDGESRKARVELGEGSRAQQRVNSANDGKGIDAQGSILS
jgi:hypothetical protein